MSTRFARFGAVVLLAGSFWAGVVFAFPRAAQAPSADSAPKATEDVQAKFEMLKKRLPGIISKWSKDILRDPHMRIARLTSSYEAKITISAKDTASDSDDKDNVYTFTLYLRYYRGVWTTVGLETMPVLLPLLQQLALIIDEDKAK